MKILYLVNTLNTASGWGRFSREIVERVASSGINVRILCEHASGFPGEKVCLKRSWGAIPAAVGIRDYVRKEDIDLVHSMEANPYAITADLALTGLNIPHVITATGAYSIRPLYQWSTKFLLKRAYKRAKQVLCISGYIENEIQKKISLKNTKVITLGVDFDKFSGSRKESEHPYILSVGNLTYRKGYQISVAAFAEIAKEIPDIQYYIAGSIDQNIYSKCQEIIQKNNITNRVIFLGSVDDARLRKLYLSAELFILTAVNEDYHFEGFGLVFLEAAAAGLPVIGTTGNGIRDAISEGNNGLLVDQNDIHSTASALRKILTDKELRESFSQESIKWAKRNNWEQVVSKYMNVYRELNV